MKQHIISFLNEKGGVGKTTATLTIATILAVHYNKRVCVIDCDPQGNLSRNLGFESDNTLYTILDVLLEDVPIENTLNTIKKTHNKRFFKKKDLEFDLICCNKEKIRDNDYFNLMNYPDKEFGLKNAIAKSKDMTAYDFILLDCPPNMTDGFSLNCLVASTSVIVPMKIDQGSIDGIRELLYTIDRVQNNSNRELDFTGVFITMLQKNTGLGQQFPEQLSAMLEGKFFNHHVRASNVVNESPFYLKTLIEHSNSNKVVEDYRKVTDELLKRLAKEKEVEE